VAGVLAYPFPKTTSSVHAGYNQIASGRVVYDTDNTPIDSNEELCATGCDIDWTCKGFTTWKTGKGIFEVPKCLKQKTVVKPWTTIPGWLVDKPGANIFVKTS
jgi:hypothetical protein